MLTGQPKHQKKGSVSDVIADAPVAITKAFSPNSTVMTPSVNPQIGASPGKSVELCMKNFEQLR